MAMGDTGGRIDALLRGIVGEYLGNFEEAAGHSAALAQFGYLTMSGGEWDHKPQLQQRFALESSDFRTEILANGPGGKAPLRCLVEHPLRLRRTSCRVRPRRTDRGIARDRRSVRSDRPSGR